MSLAAAVIIFFALTLALAALPFVPALVEWRRRQDDQPLKIVRESEVNIRHFAEGFRVFLQTRLAPALENCRKSKRTQEGTLGDGMPFVVVNNETTLALSGTERKNRAAKRLIVSCEDLRLPEETMFLPEIYADGTVRGGEGNIYRAVMADDQILLDRESLSLRWLHATRSVSARAGCVLYGRVSADQFIRLERGCRFERLHAPRVEFCFEGACVDSGGTVVHESDLLKPRDLDRPVEVAAGRWLISGRLEVPKNKIVKADLVTTKEAYVRAGARVFGSVKSHKDMFVEREAEVMGSLVSGRDLYIGRGCRIHGPVLAERVIYMEQGTVVGSAEKLTTVSAEYAYIAPGATVHGTVWAHIDGRVIAPSDLPAETRPSRKAAGV